jgi:hypothetical protein
MGKKKSAPKKPTAASALEMIARPAKYTHINPRHEKHGKDGVQLCIDISVRGYHIDEGELDHILGAKAWASLFNAANGKGKPAEPFFRNIAPIVCSDEFEGCDAKFSLGLTDAAIEFEDAFISKIVLEPQIGGLTLMNFTVSVEIEDEGDVASLLRCMGDESTVSIFLGGKYVPKDAKAQTSLELGPTDKTPPSADKAAESQADAVH